jgi:8-oxo-dGTP pyrophosphatase MutT (NUDIX family)
MAERDRFVVVVHVVVMNGTSFALLKRANTGFMDGYYALPGGHQQAGESVVAAARRECEEELGVRPLSLEPECVLPYTSGRHQGINFVFSCSEYEGTVAINEPELFDDLIWCDLSVTGRLPEPCPDWIPIALDLVGGSGWYREMEWD